MTAASAAHHEPHQIYRSTIGGAVEILERLRHAEDVRCLLASAAEVALDELPIDRAVVLAPACDLLTAADCGAIGHDPSDRLRRRVLGAPVTLAAQSIEARILAGRHTRAQMMTGRSVLAEALGLQAFGLAPITPEVSPVGLLVVDRVASPLDEREHASLRELAVLVGIALGQVLLRERVKAIARELRQTVASTQALLGELHDAPLHLPSSNGHGMTRVWDLRSVDPDPATAVLSDREIDVVERLVAGRTNREIAEELYLSPATVKAHVARILRKLDVTNRVELVARYLAMPRSCEQ